MAKQPLEIGTFDFETDPFKYGREPMPFLGGCFDGHAHVDFWDVDCAKKVMDYILAHPRIWYAHNGGKFDFHLLLRYIPRNKIKKMLCIGGRIVQIVLRISKGITCELRDSYALIPRALREWAKENIDITKLERDVRESNKIEIVKYYHGDKIYLYEMLSQFVASYGMHLTLASASFKILHKRFGVKKTHLSEHMDAKFRSFYFAGRVEFYGLGEMGGGYTCVDVNSSFPWSMTLPHWEGDKFISTSNEPKEKLEQSFFRIEVESHGAFAFREENGGVSFPRDTKRREFFTTGWEYKAAKDLGLLKKCKIISCFTPVSIRDYKEFIYHFNSLKEKADQTGNKGERLFAKLLMNSGYGKFGMDPREFEEVLLCDWRKSPGPEWNILKDDPQNGITIYKRPAPNIDNKFNNVCVAASITGCSRALLLRAIFSCDGVAYCDTDSIIAKDIKGIIIGDKLGQWKVEHYFDKFYIGGKKLYAGFGKDAKGKDKWKTASKGVRLSPDQIIEVSKGNEIQFTFDAPSYSIRDIKSEQQGGKKHATKWIRFTKRKIRRADKIIKR